jgi:hypothetical protein
MNGGLLMNCILLPDKFDINYETMVGKQTPMIINYDHNIKKLDSDLLRKIVEGIHGKKNKDGKV